MTRKWTAENIGELTHSYQPALVLMAAAELDLYDALGKSAMTAAKLTTKLGTDQRGFTMLLDALAGLGFLLKKGERYSAAPGMFDVMTSQGKHTMLAMTQHQATCVRRWIQLAEVVKSGQPSKRMDSIRGSDGDQQSFITAMDNISGAAAVRVVSDLKGLKFKTLLDVGGASGSWTIEFLRKYPKARAILFDLPVVIPMARERIGAAGLLDRVQLVPGDFYHDPLPKGADLVWVSAIVHQNSREQNRELYTKAYDSLPSAGQILIRDHVMDKTRTKPVSGVLFAINMLTGPHLGGTFTLAEYKEDLEATGFKKIALVRKDEGMHAVVSARKIDEA